MNRFRECRMKAGYSQKEVRLELGLASSSVSAWETGKAVPSRQNLARLAELYGVSADYLLGLDDKPLQPQQATPIAFDTDLLQFVSTASQLTDEERDQVKVFMEFLIHRRNT